MKTVTSIIFEINKMFFFKNCYQVPILRTSFLIRGNWDTCTRIQLERPLYLLLAELSKGAGDVVLCSPLHEYIFVWHNDGDTGSLEAVSVQVGLGHIR